MKKDHAEKASGKQITQIEAARKGEITAQMKLAAEAEGIESDLIRSGVADGTIVVPANLAHINLVPCAIGKGLRTKVNANIGTSSARCDPNGEMAKLKTAIEFGADAVMDLSIAGNVSEMRRNIIKAASVPIGTVPIYQAALESITKRGSIVEMTDDDIFNVIEEQAADGVDFMTVHCGVTRSAIDRLRRQGRVADVVSRGGSFLVAWILHNQKENPLYDQYDRLLSIARQFDITLSLGDGMRPGSIADATDRAQVDELLTLGELTQRAREAGVQVIVEGPGHVPLDQIEANIKLQKSICRGAPFYVLGPLVTDIGAGYDHITGAIGGAIAAAAGADFLCYVTAAEHLGLPEINDVKNGVIASRIAGHAADIVKGVKGAAEKDTMMSRARKSLDWEKQAELSFDPTRARQVHGPATNSDTCSMCGDFCAMKLVGNYLGTPAPKCS